MAKNDSIFQKKEIKRLKLRKDSLDTCRWVAFANFGDFSLFFIIIITFVQKFLGRAKKSIFGDLSKMQFLAKNLTI